MRAPLREWGVKWLPIMDEETFPFQWPPRYNIAPTQGVPCIYRDAETETPVVDIHRWGLVPFWADDIAIGNRMINARSETAAEKPSFRAAFKRRRCLIPASGYYEWKREGGVKQPYYIHPPDDAVVHFAGLWEENTKATGEPVRTCTILTTRANSVTGRVHDRMPVIIEPDDQPKWVDPTFDDRDELQALMEPAVEEAFDLHPVDRRVGSPKNDDARMIEPIG